VVQGDPQARRQDRLGNRERFKAHPERTSYAEAEPPKPEPPKPESNPSSRTPGKAQWFKAIRKRDGKVIWVTRERFKAHPERYELRKQPEPEERKPREKQPPKEQKKPLTQEFLQQQARTLHRALNVYLRPRATSGPAR